MGTQLLKAPRVSGTTYARILVPVDGSVLAEAALPHAIAMARRFGATIELTRSYTPPASLLAASAASAMPGTGPILDAGPFIAAARDEAEVYLAALAARIRREGVTVEQRRLDGSAGESIAMESLRAEVDLIVMTTHGRGGLGRLVLGSVADHVLRHADCPVLLIRADSAPAN